MTLTIKDTNTGPGTASHATKGNAIRTTVTEGIE